MTIPYTFAGATTAIPLAQLDANFASPITLGNVAMTLSNTYTSIGNLTLTNVTISSTSTPITVPQGGTGLTSLTAGYIPFGNGTSAFNSSSNLYFDGTNLVVGGYISALGGNSPTGGFQLPNIAGTKTPRLTNDGADGTIIRPGASGAYVSVNNYANSANLLYVADSGNVGIGTTTPSGRNGSNKVLQVSTANEPEIKISTTGSGQNAWLSFSPTASSGDAWISNIVAGSNLIFANGGYTTERMRIDSSGNLLVGTTSQNGAGGFSVSPNATAPELMVKGSATTNTSTTYEVYSTGASAYRFYVGFGGTVYATSIVITAISDERLKENIKDIDTGLNAVMALKPRRFDWKDGKGQDKKNVAGFIAQEFETIFPECVGTSKAGEDGIEYKNINHETLIPTLVKAIQELNAKVTALETQLGTK